MKLLNNFYNLPNNYHDKKISKNRVLAAENVSDFYLSQTSLLWVQALV